MGQRKFLVRDEWRTATKSFTNCQSACSQYSPWKDQIQNYRRSKGTLAFIIVLKFTHHRYQAKCITKLALLRRKLDESGGTARVTAEVGIYRYATGNRAGLTIIPIPYRKMRSTIATYTIMSLRVAFDARTKTNELRAKFFWKKAITRDLFYEIDRVSICIADRRYTDETPYLTRHANRADELAAGSSALVVASVRHRVGSTEREIIG